MYYYMQYCRFSPTSQLVFQTARGSQWLRASGDIKAYLNERGFDADKVDPSGRLVHGSRHIGLATYSILVNFNKNMISNYTILMRHSLSMAEKVYSPWIKLYQAKMAVTAVAKQWGVAADDLADVGGQQLPQFPVYQVRLPPNRVLLAIQTSMKQQYSPLNLIPTSVNWDRKSQSTQTDSDHQPSLPTPERSHQTKKRRSEASEKKEHATSDWKEFPTVCDGGHALELYGPFSLSRNKERFGRYYLECKKCYLHAKAANQKRVKRKLWIYPLGFEPEVGKLLTATKPRNNEKIRQFVAAGQHPQEVSVERATIRDP
jgi:hypothetical protein